MWPAHIQVTKEEEVDNHLGRGEMRLLAAASAATDGLAAVCRTHT
jgi:hypothetical protein